MFDSLLNIWQQVEPSLEMFIYHWAHFHCYTNGQIWKNPYSQLVILDMKHYVMGNLTKALYKSRSSPVIEKILLA